MATTERPRIPVKDRALHLLSVRSRSREELRRRLLRAGYEGEEIEPTLADLEAVGLVDDERFAREMATYELRRRGMGRRAGLASLREKGVDRDLAERVVEEVGPEDEEERAVEVARERLSRLAGLAPAIAERRLLGFLMRRGYDGHAARAACRRVLGQGETP